MEMGTIVKILVIVLAFVGMVAWVRLTVPDVPRISRDSDLVATVAKAQDDKRFVNEGMLMVYVGGSTPTYYLLYEAQGGQFMRKELRFVDGRGCTPQAGDLPCVFQEDPNAPPVAIGTHVRVEGIIDAQRILVSHITPVPDTMNRFQIVSLNSGDTVELTDLMLKVENVSREGGCTVFSGCYGDGIPRAAFTYDAESRDGEKTFVPGMFLDIKNGNLLLLWASEERDEAAFVIARSTRN